jgi:aldehyde dehydrogenase (NAD+)
MFDRIEWEQDLGTIEMMGSKHRRMVVKEPAGVVGAIIPWNVPFYITIGKCIPALLTGCTVILKPAPRRR